MLGVLGAAADALDEPAGHLVLGDGVDAPVLEVGGEWCSERRFGTPVASQEDSAVGRVRFWFPSLLGVQELFHGVEDERR